MIDIRKNIGKMDRRILVRSVTRTIDTYGAPAKAWTTLFNAWAIREEASSAANQEQQTTNRVIYPGSYTYYMHYRSGVTEAMRLVDDEKVYNILSVDPDERKMFLRINVDKALETASDIVDITGITVDRTDITVDSGVYTSDQA